MVLLLIYIIWWFWFLGLFVMFGLVVVGFVVWGCIGRVCFVGLCVSWNVFLVSALCSILVVMYFEVKVIGRLGWMLCILCSRLIFE